MSIWEQLTGYLSFSFVRYALIAGVLIALCSSLLGVTLVLKRFSVIGDGLSHVAFGALAIATVLRLSNNMLLVMPVTVVCAVILLCANQNAKIKGDAAIAMLSVSALAIGYLIQNLFSASANISGDVCSTLFGSTLILTLSKSDVWLCVGMSVVVMAIFLLFYHKIFAVTFDETFAAATMFARSEGIIPAPESSHAIAAAIREAKKAKEAGESKVILFNLSGHGLIDMSAYDQYIAGDLANYQVSEEMVRQNTKDLEKII